MVSISRWIDAATGSRRMVVKAGLLVGLMAQCLAGTAAAGTSGSASQPPGVYPPWSGGANNPVQSRGLEFTVPEVDNLPDLHGNPVNPELSIFVGGNYFFVMAPLVHAFEQSHPALKGKIYYETLPPGLLVDQLRHGGTITIGNMTWTVHADVYAGGMRRVESTLKEGLATGTAVPYATNTLTIMVPKGNPARITSLNDLGKPGVRLVMPNPAFEGVGRQIKESLAKAGGEALVRAVYETKVKNGETILTHIHHRQSPMYLMQGKAQAGVTWQSEAAFQEMIGNPISHVAIPDDQNATGTYGAAVVRGAPHPEAAKQWIEFLTSPEAQDIFKRYGFKS